MNLWKREEPRPMRAAERRWLLGGGSWSSSSSSLDSLIIGVRNNGRGRGGGGYGTCGEMPNDKEVDRGPSYWEIGQKKAIGPRRRQFNWTHPPMMNMGNETEMRRENGMAGTKYGKQENSVAANKSAAGPKSKSRPVAALKMDLLSTGENATMGRREEGDESDEKGRRASTDTEEEALEYMVAIPETNGQSAFSWRKLWAFTGPGFLMSIAYLDPGNIESDLQSGTIARYRLLWVLLMAHVLGFFLQRLSARLGVVAGRTMSEIAYEYYPKVPRLILWAMIEIAIICSDMQEVIGTAIAFALLSNGRIPLFVGVLITMADTFTFLLIDRYGFRKLEFIFALLISTMAITFGYEFIIVKPELVDLVEGTFLPYCPGCGRKEFLQAVSVVGAVIMPHNLYLHSALVKSRRVDRSRRENVSEANLYYFIECTIALTCSFFINLFVVAVFAHGLFGKTNADIHKTCQGKMEIPDADIFPNNTELVEADIYKGGIFLGCQFGLLALYVWGVGIMAAGQSSTMTGTYAGQFVMEGFLQIKWPRWRRVLFTRSIAIVPTLFVALKAQGVANLTGMNDLLNCVQMIQLPFALLPIITFTAHRRIMFDFCSSLAGQVFALLVSCIVIFINLYFSSDYILGALGHTWYSWALLLGPGSLYMAFVLYLMLTCLQSMSILPANIFNRLPWLAHQDDQLTVSAPWMGRNGQISGGQLSTSRDPIHEEGGNGGGEANIAFNGQSSVLVVDGHSSGDSL